MSLTVEITTHSTVQISYLALVLTHLFLSTHITSICLNLLIGYQLAILDILTLDPLLMHVESLV